MSFIVIILYNKSAYMSGVLALVILAEDTLNGLSAIIKCITTLNKS